MNAKLKKTVKVCIWILAILILIPIVLVATLPLWLGPVVKPSLNALAPKFTKTDFRIEKLYLNPYTCNFELGGIRVGNPEGFSETNAFTLGYFNVDVDTDSLWKDVIIVDNVEISDICVSWIKNKEGKTNLDIIEQNMTGARNEFEKQQAKEQKKEEEAQRRAGMSEQQIKAEKEAKKINRKLIVNRFVFKNVSGKVDVPGVGVVPFRVPSIELKDIGRASGGLDLDSLHTAVVKEFWASVMKSAVNLKGLLGDGAGKAFDSMMNAGASIKDSAAVKQTTESLKKAGDSLKSATSDSFKKAGDSLKGATDSLKGATDSLKKLF